MKQVYLPTKEELLIIQEENANVYKYILVKVIEKLITNNIRITTIPSDLSDIYELYYIMCYVYPDSIYHIPCQNDISLCNKILDKPNDKTIYSLDALSRFNTKVLNDDNITIKTISLLHTLLPKNINYRFEYKKNALLDSIFNIDYQRFAKYDIDTLSKLATIDPIYLLKLPISTINLSDSINKYGLMYGLDDNICPNYIHADIINKPDDKVKKLIKYLAQ